MEPLCLPYFHELAEVEVAASLEWDLSIVDVETS